MGPNLLPLLYDGIMPMLSTCKLNPNTHTYLGENRYYKERYDLELLHAIFSLHELAYP